MNSYARLAAAAAAIVLVGVVGWWLLPTTPSVGPSIAPSAAPRVSVAPSSAGRTVLSEGPLTARFYETTVQDVRITFNMPADASRWEGGDASFIGVQPMVEPPNGVLLAFNAVTSVMVDPCLDHGARPVGLGGMDLANAWAALPHAEVEGPTEGEWGGYPTSVVSLRIDDDLSECVIESLGIYYIGSIARVVEAGQDVTLVAVDVDGTRIVVESSYFPGSSAADIRDLTRILESVRFQPNP